MPHSDLRHRRRGLSLVINLLVLFLIVAYLALIYWTYLDAKRRIEDPC